MRPQGPHGLQRPLPGFPRLPAGKLMIPAQARLAARADPPAPLTLSGHIESGLAASSALSEPSTSRRRADRAALLGKSWSCLRVAGEEPRQEGGAPVAGTEQLLPRPARGCRSHAAHLGSVMTPSRLSRVKSFLPGKATIPLILESCKGTGQGQLSRRPGRVPVAHQGGKRARCSKTQRLPLRKPCAAFSLDAINPSLKGAEALPRLGLAPRERA